MVSLATARASSVSVPWTYEPGDGSAGMRVQPRLSLEVVPRSRTHIRLVFAGVYVGCVLRLFDGYGYAVS